MGKTEAAKALAAGAGHAAGAPAVLRGHRCGRGAVRVELPPPAARHPAGRGGGDASWPRTTCSAATTWWSGRCCRPSSTPGPRPAVLLVDEIDRADDEFEAFLLELLAEAAVTIPELGTVRAAVPPVVVLTSNRTRDLHDALKRRCLYHWIDYPDLERAVAIVRRRVPGASTTLAEQVAAAVGSACAPSTCRSPRAWPRPSTGCPRSACSASTAWTPRPPSATLGSVLKYREDLDLARGAASRGSPAGRERSRELGAVAGPGRPGRARGSVRPAPPRRRGAGHPRAQRRLRRRRGTGPADRLEELYWAGRVTLLSGRAEIETYDRVFGQVFRGLADVADWRGQAPPSSAAPRRPRRAARRRRAAAPPPGNGEADRKPPAAAEPDVTPAARCRPRRRAGRGRPARRRQRRGASAATGTSRS